MIKCIINNGIFSPDTIKDSIADYLFIYLLFLWIHLLFNIIFELSVGLNYQITVFVCHLLTIREYDQSSDMLLIKFSLVSTDAHKSCVTHPCVRWFAVFPQYLFIYFLTH